MHLRVFWSLKPALRASPGQGEAQALHGAVLREARDQGPERQGDRPGEGGRNEVRARSAWQEPVLAVPVYLRFFDDFRYIHGI